MLESVKKLFNKLRFKHRHYEPPAKPHWTVEQFGSGYLYYKYKPINCPDVDYCRYTGNAFNNKRFKEVEAIACTGQVLFKGYVSFN